MWRKARRSSPAALQGPWDGPGNHPKDVTKWENRRVTIRTLRYTSPSVYVFYSTAITDAGLHALAIESTAVSVANAGVAGIATVTRPDKSAPPLRVPRRGVDESREPCGDVVGDL